MFTRNLSKVDAVQNHNRKTGSRSENHHLWMCRKVSKQEHIVLMHQFCSGALFVLLLVPFISNQQHCSITPQWNHVPKRCSNKPEGAAVTCRELSALVL